MAPEIRQVTKNSEARWLVDHRAEGRRVRKYFKTKAEAQQFTSSLKDQVQRVGHIWASWGAQKRVEVQLLCKQIEDAGFTLQQVWDGFRASKHLVIERRIKMGDAVEQMLAEKRNANAGENYLLQLALHLTKFASGREEMWLDQVTREHIVEYFTDRKLADSTRQSTFTRIATLFEFWKRRRYISHNPCDEIQRVKVRRKAPKILTVRQAARFMVKTKREHPRFLAWAALALFAGVRPEELDKLSWREIDLGAGIVRIEYEVGKMGRRRIVHLRPAALAWLRVAKQAEAEFGMPHVSRRRYIRAMRDFFGWEKWPQDVLRHSAASYWLADVRDAGAVALELGHSVQMLFTHYREVVRREDAERFWNLIPREQRKQLTQAPDEGPNSEV